MRRICNVVRMFFIAAPTEKDCDKTSAAQNAMDVANDVR